MFSIVLFLSGDSTITCFLSSIVAKYVSATMRRSFFCQCYYFQSVKKVKIYFRDEMDRTLMLRSINFIKNGKKIGKKAALTSQMDRDCWAKRFKRSYLNGEGALESGGKKVATVKSVAKCSMLHMLRTAFTMTS